MTDQDVLDAIWPTVGPVLGRFLDAPINDTTKARVRSAVIGCLIGMGLDPERADCDVSSTHNEITVSLPLHTREALREWLERRHA